MKGMILAAGYGTRLESGDDPKPLVRAGGRPMIAWAIDALEHAGCSEIIVNLHHRAELIQDFLDKSASSVPVITVHEDVILGTGGGVLHARRFLEGGEFILYNADIVTQQDLRHLVEAHRSSGALATLMVNERETSRALLFDGDLRLLGKERWGEEGMSFPEYVLRRGFCGVHVISPRLFELEYPEGFSDIFDVYRSALERGLPLRGFESTEYWSDLGTRERITAYEQWLAGSSSEME